MTTAFSVIPRRFSCTAALDTSALSNVLKNRDEVDRFVWAVRRKHATVCVSDLVVFELTSISNVNGVRDKLELLQVLIRELGPLLRRSPDHKGVLRAEARRWLKGPPVHPHNWAGFETESPDEVLRLATQLPESYLWMQKKKAELLDSDRTLAAYLAGRGQQPNVPSVVDAICSTEPPRVDEMMVELTASMSDGAVSAAQIVADPVRFKATHTVSHLVWRLCIANAAGCTDTLGEAGQILGMWRTKAGNRGAGVWYDTFIAGAATYNDFLISDDSNQRDRCEFLRKRKLLSFRSISLSEFAGSE